MGGFEGVSMSVLVGKSYLVVWGNYRAIVTRIEVVELDNKGAAWMILKCTKCMSPQENLEF